MKDQRGRTGISLFTAAILLLLTAAPIIIFGCNNKLMEILESPEISVWFGDREVMTGETITPENTEFGSSRTLTFTIRNKGKTGGLILSDQTPITVTGDNVTMYSFTPPAVLIVEPESSTNFSVTFTPSAVRASRTPWSA